MAVSPLHPALALSPAPAQLVAAAPADLAMAVAAPVDASDGNGARNATSQPARAQPPQPAAQTLEKALDDINRQMKAWSTQLQFEIDPDIHRVVVSIVDSESGDVMRTIPSDAVLRVARMIVKLQGNAVETSA